MPENFSFPGKKLLNFPAPGYIIRSAVMKMNRPDDAPGTTKSLSFKGLFVSCERQKRKVFHHEGRGCS